jgi:hypothetical protein
MKVVNYLNKFNVKPKYDRVSVLSTIIWLVDCFFNSHTIVEPDCLEWVQDGWRGEEGTTERFNERCNLVLYTTAGDIRASMPYLVKQNDQTLYELMIELLDTLVMYQGFAEGDMDSWESMKNSQHWAKLWNKCLSVENGEDMWSNKAEIIEAYSSDQRFVETAEKVIESHSRNILKKVFELDSEFCKFVKNHEKVECTGGAIEMGNPLDGSHVRVIDLSIKNDENSFFPCLLYWAPMPRIEAPEDAPEEVKTVCKEWSDKKRTQWFDGICKQDQKTRDLPEEMLQNETA